MSCEYVLQSGSNVVHRMPGGQVCAPRFLQLFMLGWEYQQ
jgi:hypothetical protein